ncbi:ABC-F family ATP-binding cassette domain-containing protein [Jeotgalibaca ciconiae]|uniref:ABC transporter ATP-binding protein n=1 Tax=Jeotgalibaca ciconiae TaxID=2496265 RepID=A0A3S9HDC4_9LACT|nr:ABC-F family ATP-binding cassette domain-containing protein [Jeotgalibaca ciconiae]AZP05359.1 ABC transporter ATP-binding protein [Jeotgalibaca ciconiae]HJB22588.1 ABC-F family ATP-binding cassette domain-containing protein [Candidatus Jeotgalibaca pullicola]
MKDLKAIEISKTYGVKQLFNNVSFTIREGEYVGLIGPNGSGKSSLMEILAGKDVADSGSVDKPNDFRISYLSQEPEMKEEHTVFEAVFEGDAPIARVVRDYEKAVSLLAEDSMSAHHQKEYARAEQEMNAKDAWQAEVQFKTILNKLGIHELDKKIGELSGGQRKRVGLAQVLIQAPNLLLLDEPTNHLDVEAIIWLEKYLSQYKGSLLLITHDRYFLERVTNHMLELKNGNIESYSGNYASYLEQKSEREAIQQRMDEKQAKLYKNELAWMRKGAKARTTKQQARIHRFENLEQDIKQSSGDEPQLEIALEGSRLGKRVFNLENVTLEIGGKTILEHFNHIFQSTDRIGIVGKNGSGKTTLLKMLAGDIQPSSGNFIIGETVRIGYYRQIMEPFPEDKRVINYLQEIAEEAKRKDGITVSVTELLETFLFPREMHGSLIRTLSGGEKRRLYLLKILMNQPNVLLFDEPTNDLDIDTLTVLEDFLTTFQGAVLVVSHDRYFLDKVSQKLLVLDHPSGPALYYGNMSDYLESDLLKSEVSTSVNKKVSSEYVPKEKQEKTKLTYSEQIEWKSIEEDIMLVEEEVEHLKNEMTEHTSDYAKLAELQEELEKTEEKLTNHWNRYEYLSQFIDE